MTHPSASRMARRLSAASAVLILVGGYVHLCLYRHGYQAIPKIGVSFLLQATSSLVLATALVVRSGRMHLGGRSFTVAGLARLGAVGFSISTLVALAVAHTPGGLFQLHESGLQPAPQTLIAIAAESLAVLLLTAAMIEARVAVRSVRVTAAVVSPSRHAIRDAA